MKVRLINLTDCSNKVLRLRISYACKCMSALLLKLKMLYQIVFHRATTIAYVDSKINYLQADGTESCA